MTINWLSQFPNDADRMPPVVKLFADLKEMTFQYILYSTVVIFTEFTAPHHKS